VFRNLIAFDGARRFEVPATLVAVSVTTVERAQTLPPLGAAALAWLIPGAGHLVLGKRQKGMVFLIAIPAMFFLGLAMSGRIFPFDFTQPLAALAAVAARGIGVPAFVAGFLGWGSGVVTAATYEYGNTFVIVAGLLNMLVALDAFDVASGRK
jgi:hypothetical protein